MALTDEPASGAMEEIASRDGGWCDLAAGRWRAARETFAAELRERETAEAHEGLSWAAWWLDEADTVFASRQRAFELYRELGQPASAARMATWLAADQLDFHGAVSVARGWLASARRLLEPLEPGADHGWLHFTRAISPTPAPMRTER